MGPSPLSFIALLGEFLEASPSGLPNHLSRLENRDHEEDQAVFCRTQLDLWVTPVALMLRPALGVSPVTASAKHLGPCFCRQGPHAAPQHVQAGEVLCPLPSPTPPSPPCETKVGCWCPLGLGACSPCFLHEAGRWLLFAGAAWLWPLGWEQLLLPGGSARRGFPRQL